MGYNNPLIKVYSMTKSRPTYSTEFRNDAAQLVLDKNYSVADACTAVGVGYTAMRRWVNQLEGERNGITPGAKAITTEHRHIQALEARIKQVEWENSILKKATALLAQDNMKR
jgi:transposase